MVRWWGCRGGYLLLFIECVGIRDRDLRHHVRSLLVIDKFMRQTVLQIKQNDHSNISSGKIDPEIQSLHYHNSSLLLQSFESNFKYMLPPSFEHKHTHSYGTLSLTLNNLKLPNLPLRSLEPHFFGKANQHCSSSPLAPPFAFHYQIATNLWHFYSYLSDCRSITLLFTSSSGQVYTAELVLEMLPSGQVLNRFNTCLDYLFRGNSYLLNRKSSLKVYDRGHRVVGEVQVQITLKFEEEINRVLFEAEMVDFDDLLVIDEISPVPSSIELPSSILQNQDKLIKLPESLRHSTEIAKPQEIQKPNPSVHIQQVVHLHQMDDDEKMLEDDIDRLIAEMQNRPYDSTRYLENSSISQPNHKQNHNHQNLSGFPSQPKSLGKVSADRSSDKLPPKYPGASHSNHSLQIRQQPIFSYTAKESFSSHRTNYLMQTNSHPLICTQSRRSTSREVECSEARKGLVHLKIHELMMQQPEAQLSLVLRLFLNDDSNQYYSTNSMRQGQAILFNSSIKIDEKTEINQLRFQLIDSFDMKTVYCRGSFDMKRLYDLSPAKGIFMVNMLTAQNSHQNRIIRAEESQLVRIVPNLKSLRIELQYEEAVEIVQVYLNLGDFSSTVRQCRYKIPLTKETIDFRVSELANSNHVNIFPHNRSPSSGLSQNIIVELWGEKELIGFSQISLKQLSNTNQRMINSSLSPIHLYDETREVSNFKGGKSKGSFWLHLCYGTVSQIQNLLNQQPSRKEPKKQYPKKQVEVESHLGIYLKEQKDKREVQIQVDSELPPENPILVSGLSKKTELQLLQQQQLPDDEDEEGEEIELEKGPATSRTQENQFLNKTMQDKYLKGETVPLLNKQEYLPAKQKVSFQTNLSATLRDRCSLKSLTGEFQQLIRQTLSVFSSESIFQTFKSECHQNLLYTFIESAKLQEILIDLGMDTVKVHLLLHDILSQANAMININMLYDLIYGLLLEGQVKEKYIDDQQLGRYCLLRLYRAIREQQPPELDEFVFDDDLEFGEARKVYELLNYKLTMRQYNQICQFLKKQSQKEPHFSNNWLRDKLLGQVEEQEKKEEEKQQYRQEVQKQIYSKYEWDDEDDFFISNINQPNNPSATPSSLSSTEQLHPIAHATHHVQQTKISTAFLDLQAQEGSNKLTPIPQPMKTPVQSPASKATHIMLIQGLQGCIDAAECHLNVELRCPKLKISAASQAHTLQIGGGEESRERWQLPLSVGSGEDYLDGGVQLLSGQQVVARCNFSMIKGVRSVYALKSIKQSQFCGLIYLQFSEA